MEPVARLEGVSVHFGPRTALRDVTLTIPEHRATVLLGPSGSGKTTLLRCLNRLNELFEGHRQEGHVRLRIDGRVYETDDPGMDVSWLRRRVGMVFQTPNVLPLSVEKNLSVPLRLALGIEGRAARERIEAALRDAELWDEVADRLREPALSLSGGQQQRLCLARALALEPAVLLLDEPTASLDFRAARRIEALVLGLKARYTIVAVSHSLGQATRLADVGVILREGKVVEEVEGSDLSDPGRFRRLVAEIF